MASGQENREFTSCAEHSVYRISDWTVNVAGPLDSRAAVAISLQRDRAAR